jgi:hypothetical protein
LQVYVGGDAFADVRRVSGATGPTTTKLDATTAGGGVRVGGFLAPRWSLELGVDVGGTAEGNLSLTNGAVTQSIGGLPSSVITLTIDEHVTTLVAATSVLVGYHPPARGRLRPGFRAGMSFMRSSSTVTLTQRYTSSDPRLFPISGLPSPTTTTSMSVALDTAATVAGELAVALSQRAALVPEMRTHAFGGRFILRPSVALRWFF